MKKLIALLAGAAFPLALAPFDLWPIGLLAIAAWFSLLKDTGLKQAMLFSFLFGMGKYGVGASWVYVSIHNFGNAPVWLAVVMVMLFAAVLALFTLVQGGLYCWLRRGGHLLQALIFAAVFAFSEWLLTWVLTGFPWLFAGYGHLDTVLMGYAPIGGVILVGFMVAYSAALWSRPKMLTGVLTGLALWLGGWALGYVQWTTLGVEKSVALVQGNVDQTTKWLPKNRPIIARHYQTLSAPYWQQDLIVWPEAALTTFLHEAQPLLDELGAQAKKSKTGLVLGIPALERLPDGEVVFRNTAIGIGQASGIYLKQHLVPFGEYVPLEFVLRGLIEFFDLPMSRARGGDNDQEPLQILGQPDTTALVTSERSTAAKAAVVICYEIAYPELVRQLGLKSDVLLTISNDTWFGRSIGPLQHMQMARMRALENGKYLLRATNNGVTAIVDHRGRTIARLEQFVPGVLVGKFRLTSGQTLYSRTGDWPLLVFCVMVVLASRLYTRQHENVP